MDSGAYPTDAGAYPTDFGLSETIFGCPLSSYLAIETLCAVTDFPPCATLTPESSWGAGCCGSLSVYGSSVGSCFAAHAPACLDTAALASSLSASPVTGVVDPCGGFAGGMDSGAKITPPGSTNTALSLANGIVVDTSSLSDKSGTTAKETSKATTSATSGSTVTSGSTATATAASSAAAKSARRMAGAGLKVYVGVALIGALGVLSL